MDWITGIQNAIDYIEDNIKSELDYKKIADQAFCSAFYFQRIFSILCGITLGEYIRNRRLTLAGIDITSTNKKIIDIAMTYGYESPESFTRAFTKFHGITPSEARHNSSMLKSFSRLKVQIILKGGNIMNYRIVEKEAFYVLEKVENHKIVDSQHINTIPDFWSRAHSDGIINTLLSKSSDNTYIFGICYGNNHTDCQTFDYSIAVNCNSDVIVPEGYRINKIPERTWIIFECIGSMPHTIQKLWHQICSEFFPTSNYIPTYEMDIEAYTKGNMTMNDYKSEIWVPVIKK